MTDELLEALKRADPIDEEEIGRRGAAEDELAAIMAQPREPMDPGLRARVRPGGRPRWRLAAGVGVLALLLGAVAAGLPGGSGEQSSEAVSVLQSVASVARADAAPTETSALTYSKLIQADVASAPEPSFEYSWRATSTIEEWIAPDGSGRIREVTDPAEFVGQRDEQNWRSSGADPLGVSPGVTDKHVGPRELDGDSSEGALPPVRDLPADPDQLAEIFEAERARSSSSVPLNVKSFEYAGAVLMHAGSSPELRGALYDLVANIDGVELSGNVRDPIGRVGTGVSIESDYAGIPTRYTLIFDPGTSQPLAQTSRLLEPQPWIDGNLLDYTVLEESSQVSGIKDRP